MLLIVKILIVSLGLSVEGMRGKGPARIQAGALLRSWDPFLEF